MGSVSGHTWLLYALGGGLGHFQRSLALARAAARRSVDVTMVFNTPWGPTSSSWFDVDSKSAGSIHLHRLPSTADRDGIAELLAPLLRQDWSAVVVDTFPRGLGGELADWLPRLSGLKVWTHRDLCPAYLEQFQIRRDWAPRYDLSLSPGDDGELTDLCQVTPPWLIALPGELMSPAAARAAWNADPELPLVVVVGAGRPHEQAELIRLSQPLSLRSDLQVRTVTLESSPVWPLLPQLAGADVVVGSGGYNIVRETQALGLPLLARAQSRMYDRQQRRILNAPHARLLPADVAPMAVNALLDEALEVLTDSNHRPPCDDEFVFPAGFANGAEVAAELILATDGADACDQESRS